MGAIIITLTIAGIVLALYGAWRNFIADFNKDFEEPFKPNKND